MWQVSKSLSPLLACASSAFSMPMCYYTKDALEKDYDKISMFANKEGLTAHARAVDIRFGKEDQD